MKCQYLKLLHLSGLLRARPLQHDAHSCINNIHDNVEFNTTRLRKDCAKFFLNYGFYKSGVETSFVSMALAAWYPMDMLGAMLMVWLLVLPLSNALPILMQEFEHFVRNLSIHEKFTRMITAIFNGDNEFVAALDRAIQSVVNHVIDTLLSKSIVIFRYIGDKDLFQKFYSKMLSNRLIASLSFSMDLEETMDDQQNEGGLRI
uniref:Cullin family profile domain-containing protein n=1 Tax=Globodera rostochiensis TaxID=31243 RepID=A0A914HXM3_GLORO